MKFTLVTLYAAGLLRGVDGIAELEECKVVWSKNGKKYEAYGDTCDAQLDCNHEIYDNGEFDPVTGDWLGSGPFIGHCETTKCKGTNSNGVPAEGTRRITICHRTCSETNPWVRITIDDDGWADLESCGHGTYHDITSECSGKDLTKWGKHTHDYIIREHGNRAEVRARLEVENKLAPGSMQPNSQIEKDYWKYWEPACPYVRREDCCDWENGDCCGDPPHIPIVKIAGAGGDPHIKRWDRKNFDFHGECDMVLVHTERAGMMNRIMDVHIRTKITDHWSSIESAAMKLGFFHLEVDTGAIYVNKSSSAYTGPFPYLVDEVELLAPETDGVITNYTVILSNYSNIIHDTPVVSKIIFQSVGTFLNVRIEGSGYDFNQSAVGLVGDWEFGKARNRDGYRYTTLTDLYPKEWQVDLAKDPALFRTAGKTKGVQDCVMPAATAPSRRLRATADKELYAKAMEACAGKVEYDNCVDDIVFTGEIELHRFHE